MPLLSKEIQNFYVINKTDIETYLKDEEKYVTDEKKQFMQAVLKNEKIKALLQEKKTIENEISVLQERKKLINKNIHRQLIHLEMLLDPNEYNDYARKKLSSIIFIPPANKENYTVEMQRYEKIKKTYILTNEGLTKENIALNLLIDLRETLHSSKKLLMHSAEKKRNIPLGTAVDALFFNRVFSQPESNPGKKHLEQLAVHEKNANNIQQTIKNAHNKLQQNIHAINEEEKNILHQVKKFLIPTKNVIRNKWAQIIKNASDSKLIEINVIPGTEYLIKNIRGLCDPQTPLDQKVNLRLAKDFFREWHEEKALAVEKAQSFPEFFIMKKIAFHDPEYSQLPVEEEFSLFQEAFFQLFYQDKRFINTLISIYKINHLPSGLKKLLTLFLDESKIEMTIDLNELIQKLANDLETALQTDLTSLGKNLAQSLNELKQVSNNHSHLGKENYEKMLALFNKIIIQKTATIRQICQTIFNENNTIKHNMKNNLSNKHYTQCAETIIKQFFYRFMLDKIIINYISNETHIKGTTLGSTQTLYKIAELNDFLADIRFKKDFIDEEKSELQLKKLLRRVNITLNDSIIKEIIQKVSTTLLDEKQNPCFASQTSIYQSELSQHSEYKNSDSSGSDTESIASLEALSFFTTEKEEFDKPLPPLRPPPPKPRPLLRKINVTSKP